MKPELSFKKALYLFSEYMKEMNWTAKTQQSYSFRIQYFFDYLGEKGITDLSTTTKEVIKEYADYLFTVKGRCSKKKMKGTSREAYFTTVKRLFRFLLRADHVPDDVTSGVAVKNTARKDLPAYLSEKKMEELLKLPNTKTVLGFRDRTILEIFYGTGIRKTELRNLKVTDVNFDENILFIEESKGMKDRIVPFGDVVRHYLKRYIEGPRKELLILNYHNSTLFLSYQGRKFSDAALNKMLSKYLEKLKLKKHITIHSLRHTFAVHMLKNGTDIRYIQEILGHNSYNTTLQYTKVGTRYLKKMYEQFHPLENQLFEDVQKTNKEFIEKITFDKKKEKK